MPDERRCAKHGESLTYIGFARYATAPGLHEGLYRRWCPGDGGHELLSRQAPDNTTAAGDATVVSSAAEGVGR